MKLGRNVAIVSGGAEQRIKLHIDAGGLKDLTIQVKKGPRPCRPSVEGIIGIGFVSSEVVLSSGSAQCQSDMTEDWPKRKRRRQVYDDASYRNQHSST